MKKRICAVLLTLVLALCLLPVPSDAANGVPARGAQGNGQPYSIMVNRRMSTVTVYGLDENGCYTVPVRAMVCSTGAPKHATPKGNYAIGKKIRWNRMLGGVYAQYLSQFYQECLFHSVCYASPRSDALLPGYYEALGAPASHGCIRLQTEDAKWIYENCGAGTLVTVYDDDDPGELGKPEKMVSDPRVQGWDPTDPVPENPWAPQWTTDLDLSADALALSPGETAALGVRRCPEGSTYPQTMLFSDAPSVAIVDGAGRIRAIGPGVARITVSCGDAEKVCELIVTTAELPLGDVSPEDWYFDDVMYLYTHALISGSHVRKYEPESPLLGAEALQLLYNLAGRPDVAETEKVSDERLWFADALDWAREHALVERDISSVTLTKGELIELLFRYDAAQPAEPDETGGAGEDASKETVPDKGLTNDETPEETPRSAIGWAIEAGLLLGDESGFLSLEDTITRAQMAALLHRYCASRGL